MSNQVYLYPFIQLVPEFDMGKTVDGINLVFIDIFNEGFGVYHVNYGFRIRDSYGDIVIDDMSKSQYMDLVKMSPHEFLDFRPFSYKMPLK